MAKIRIGFSTHFEVENELVGIGTDNPTNTKQVLGNIHATNAKAVGISTLTTYQGFLDKEARFGKSVIDINSQAGTLGEIVIDGEVTVSSGSTLCSGVDELSLTDSFSVPTGNTDDRIHCHTAGSLRFNEDLETLEFYTGDEWRTINSFKDTGNRGRGVFAGGSPSMSTISFLNIMSEGNTQNFGDLTYGLGNVAGKCSSGTRGLFSGGGNPVTDTINYITIASEGDGIDFGNLTSNVYGAGGHSSSTRGIWAGGHNGSAQINTIQYVEINTTGNALDFGDLTRAVTGYDCACGSPVRMLHAGGKPSSYEAMIDYWAIASKGNALDFGDLSQKKNNSTGVSNNTRGVWCRGELSDGVNVKRCDYVTIASTGNATDFGSINEGRYAGGASNQIRGVIVGGFKSPGSFNTNIQYITIPTAGNAIEFGEDIVSRYSHSGLSDSHGGLGGF